jgi:cytochrome b
MLGNQSGLSTAHHGPDGRTPVKVWDAATRVFHWLLLISVLAAWWTAENDQLNLHKICGLFILGLVTFRLYWGFYGSHTSRFSHFLVSPRAAWRYAQTLPRSSPGSSLGHNPMGGWSVIAMLALIGGQVALGLFATDIDGLESGPLSHFVSFRAGRLAAQLHEILFNGLLSLIVLHICAVLFYVFIKKEDILKGMITGQRNMVPPTEPSPVFLGFGRAAIGILIALIVIFALGSGFRL